ncbi:MAG: hypothetical protein MJH10_20905 [Epibacterium sp.]|nr:hypothetical protein [Epibacterium sp.]NQX75918.1 hypothetical protein [Epibacterium sp.]
MLKLLPPIVIVAAAGAASAQDNCHPRDDVFAYLAGEYGELPVAMAFLTVHLSRLGPTPRRGVGQSLSFTLTVRPAC